MLVAEILIVQTFSDKLGDRLGDILVTYNQISLGGF